MCSRRRGPGEAVNSVRPSAETTRRAHAPSVEGGVALPKSWRIFRKDPMRPDRMSSVSAAVRTLERQL